MNARRKRRLRARLRRVTRRRGATFSLLWSLMLVVVGSLLMLILVYAGAGVLAYQALQNAANSASYAGQSQVEQGENLVQLGYAQPPDLALEISAMCAASEAMLQQEEGELRLHSGFTSVTGGVTALQNGVTVSLSGQFAPAWVGQLFGFLGLAEPSITMTAVATQAYPAACM